MCKPVLCLSRSFDSVLFGVDVLHVCYSIIYISLLPPWFGDLHTYVTKQKNNNEKKVKMKQKKINKQKYMSKQLHSKMGIKDTNWKKRRRKKVIYLCMLQNEAYKNNMTTRAYQGYGNCEGKTKVNNNTRNYKWSAHGSSGCILVTLCQ